MRLFRQLVCLVAATTAVACGGGGETSTTPPVTQVTPVVSTVIVLPGVAIVEVGGSTTRTAEIRDQTGTIFAGKTATWTSSTPTVATIESATGLVRAVAVGSTTITATSDGKTGVSLVTVIPPQITSVVVGAPSAALFPGQSTTLVATLKDKNGNALTGRVVTWSSSATRVATVDADGKVNALTAGTTTITALSEGVSGNAAVIVAPPAGTVAPSVASISPATLTPGTTAIITGANFLSGAANNAVFIAGVNAPVTAATTTQLTVTVPATGLPCQSTQPVNVEVTTVSGTGAGKQVLSVATQRPLAVGTSFMVTAAGNIGCNELPTSGTYLISVFNAAKTRTGDAAFELKGASSNVVASALSPSDAVRALTPAARPLYIRTPVDPAVAAAEAEHLAHLEQNAALRRQLGSPRNYRRVPSINATRIMTPGGASKSSAPVPTVVGQNASINYNYNSCSTGVSPVITARVVYVGSKAIVLEDNSAPLAGKLDAEMTALAKEFEDVSYPLLLNFGDPLAYDSQTDANGRIIMLFTPRVNTQGANLLGFVQSCDFYPPTAGQGVSASNQAEIFYARAVTDTSASTNTLNARSQWTRLMPSTLIHEAKHILANAERNATPILTRNEETWLEEATAQLASEMFGRALHGNSWRSNSSYSGVLGCEVRPSVAGCGGGIYVMGNHFSFLSNFLQNLESKTILSGSDDSDIYGSSWLFARWLVDTYGGQDESVFLKKLILNFTQFGVDNVVAATGKSWAELLGQFTLMLAADDLPGISAPFTQQSWNLPAIWSGYNVDFSSRPASPLQPRQASFGSAFSANASIRGGGAMVLKLNSGASTGPQLLDLRAVGGTALPSTSNIGIAVLRIQ